MYRQEKKFPPRLVGDEYFERIQNEESFQTYLLRSGGVVESWRSLYHPSRQESLRVVGTLGVQIIDATGESVVGQKLLFNLSMVTDILYTEWYAFRTREGKRLPKFQSNAEKGLGWATIQDLVHILDKNEGLVQPNQAETLLGTYGSNEFVLTNGGKATADSAENFWCQYGLHNEVTKDAIRKQLEILRGHPVLGDYAVKRGVSRIMSHIRRISRK